MGVDILSLLAIPPVWAWLLAGMSASFAVFVMVAIRAAESDDPPEQD